MASKARQIALVLQHELRGTFRDRNTLIYAVILPIALYPVLFVAMTQLLQLQNRIDAATTGRLAVVRDHDLLAAEGPGEHLLESELEELLSANVARSGESRRALEFDWLEPADLDELTPTARLASEGGPHAILEIVPRGAADPPQEGDAERRWTVRAWYDPLSPASASVWRDLLPALEALRREWRERVFEARSERPRADLEIMHLARVVDATDEHLRGSRLPALLLPMILILMGTIGAFYPAIDTTAGERERGTAETTAILPTARTNLVMGKYLAVLCSSLLAFALNLVGMWLTWPLIRGSLGKAVPHSWELGFGQTLGLLATGLAFLAFVAALMLAAASFARSFKEGQALLSPLYTLILLPAMASAVPGIRLDMTTALVPFLNTALGLRAIVEGRGLEELAPIAMATGVSLLLAALALRFAVRALSSEENLIGTAGEPGKLGRLRRLLRLVAFFGKEKNA